MRYEACKWHITRQFNVTVNLCLLAKVKEGVSNSNEVFRNFGQRISYRSDTMLPTITPPKEKFDPRMETARRLAAELFAQKYHPVATNVPTAEQLQLQAKLLRKKEKSIKRTLKLISDPQCNAVYSMKTELRLITERNMEILHTELNKLSERDNIKFSALVEIIDRHMQLILFGCSIDIGICTDSSAKVIEFFGDPNYRRKVRRGDSNCFTAIDRKDLVVEAIPKHKNPMVNFTEGDHVVYVPMFGTSSAQGVMEIYGLQTLATNNAASRAVYQRSPLVLKAMMQAKDYKFVNSVRLWKKPPTTPKILEDGEIGKFYGVDAFIVAGLVTGVAQGRRGVPFYGGPRYTVKWENGETDEDITATDLLNHYKETPQSLGCSNSLDEWLSDQLMEVASTAGRILEKQRVRTFLLELRNRIQRNNMKSNVIVEIGLEAIGAMIHGTREVSLVGFNTVTKDSNSLVDFFPARNAKSKNEKAVTQVFMQTVFSVSQMMISHVAGSNPFILEDNHNTDWVAVEMAVAEDFVWSHKANYDRYFVVMNRHKTLNGATSPLDLLVLESVVCELSAAIRSLWAKELRKKVRKEVLKDLEHRIFDWKSATVNELCYNVIQHIAPHLKGADVYVGLVDPGGASMTYVASSIKSKMEGKALKRGEGVSFDVIDSLNTIILRPEDLDKGKLLMEGSIVDVFYGKKLHRCKIEKDRGHEKFDVRYDIDHKVEAGVDVSRIVPHSFAFRMKKFGKAVYPFVCVALRNRTKSVGVLGIDSFTHIPKAEYDTHPDADLIAFLEKVGAILGTNIDMQRKKISMQALYVIAKNQFSDVNDVMTATFDVLFNNLTQVTGLVAVRYVYEDGEKKSALGIQPIMTRGSVSADLHGRLDAFNPAKSSLKAVQKFGERMVFMLCRLRPAVRGEQGRIFIVGLNTAVAINDPDLEFLAVVQKLVAGTLQNIVSFKAVTELRYEALRDVKGLCEVAHRYSRQKFFNAVVDSVQSCFYSANMYVGVLSPYNKSLEYILASTQSDMVGKSLSRAEKSGVSFQIIDELKPLGVGAGSPMAFRLFHFGPRQQFEFPYIGIPLIVHVDAVIGVLGVDNCEDPAAVSDILTDTTSFFNAVGTYLGQVVRKFREEDAKIRLLQIAREAPSYAEGIRQIKKVLLEVLPFAKRVVEIVFEPSAAEVYDRTITDPALPKQVITHTTESYTVLLHVPTVFLISGHVKSAQLKCIWQGNSIFSCKVSADGETKLAPVLIHIPNAVNLDIVKIQFVLNGLIGSVDREVAHKEVDLVYLLSAPLYLMEHYFESPQTKTARVGRFHLLSKVFSESQVVGFSVTEIQIKGITNLFDTFSSHKSSIRQTTKEMRQTSKQQSTVSSTLSPKLGDVFTILRWNDELIKKTPALAPTGELSWTSLDIYLKMESILLESNILQLEVWDERKNGEVGTAYGRMTMTASSLRDYMDGTNQWLEMGALLPDAGEVGVSSASILRTNAVVRMKGRVITAAQMNRNHVEREFDSSLRVKVLDGPDGNKERQFHSCELRVICARELGRGESWAPSIEPNVFTVVYFNGEEIGRTPVVKGTTEPSWEEETFKIRVPGDEELEQCVLLVELIHLDAVTNIEQKMGRVEVQGKPLASFLTSNKLKCQWFDVQAMPQSKRSTKHVEDIIAQGELMLSGRPTSVEVTGYEEPAKELGHMELSLLSFANVRASSSGPTAAGIARTFAVVYFNGRKIHRTKLTDGKADAAWDKEKVVFRYPNNKPLYQCVLRIELWHMRTVTALKSQEVLLGAVELTASPLGKVMGQKGLITKWLAITPEADALDTSSFSPEIQVKGGPQGGKDIFEDCDEHLLLDILAATRLPLRKDSIVSDTRPNTFCEVTWNQKRIGRTAVVSASANPLWDRQRFIMRIPLITALSEASILSHCKLRLDLYDVYSELNEIAVGTLTLVGADLESLFSQVTPRVQWFPLRTTLGPDGKPIENADDEEEEEGGSLPAEIKLRGAKTGANEDSPKRLPDENLLEIVSARDLSNTDIFGGADSFVVVEYMGDELGKTQIVPKTVNPVFSAETFILKSNNIPGSPEPPNLCLSVYSKLAVTSLPVFLGRVALGRSELSVMMSAEASGNKQYTLTTSPELTEEENRMVKGALTIRMSKIKIFAHDIATKKDALLWIQSASNLPKTSAFGNSSDVFCKVFRRADREGGEDIELYQTEVAKTLSPTFKEFYIPVEIPAYEDWSGFQIRVEVWDMVNEPIGALILREGDAQKLFGRDASEALTPLNYELLDGSVLSTLGTLSPPASALPGQRGSKVNNARLLSPRSIAEKPTISLVGGLKGEFENALKSRPESPTVVFEVTEDAVPPAPSHVTSPTISRIESPVSTKFKSAKIMYAESVSSKAAVGDEAIIFITAFDSLLEAEKLFCILKWKKVAIGRTTTASPMDAEGKWSAEPFKIMLDPESALTSASLDIEVFSTSKRDAPLGVVSLTSTDIIKLFDPASTDPVEYPILDFRGPRTLAARKRPIGSVSLKGGVPRLQREYDELRSEELKQNVEIQEDPELHEAEFEMCLVKASELSRASRSMEVFATVYWGGKEEPVWKTEVVSGSINPVFDAEFCVVKKPQGIKYADCLLRVVLHNKNFLSAHTFLGEVLLTGSELQRWITSESEHTFTVAKSTIEKGGQGDTHGSVTLFIKRVTDIAASPMFNNQIPLPSHLIEMELNVLAANGLAKVNTLGLSNPFCKIHWGRAVLGQTSVVHDTLSPLWEENDSFTFRTPNAWDFKKRRKLTKNTASSHHKHSKGLSNSEMTLTIAVFNWSRLGDEVFMGCVEIQGEELAKLVSSGQYSRKWFSLGKSHHLKQRDQKFVQGRVQILLTHKPKAGEGDFSGKDVELMVCAGRDLVKRKDNAPVEIFVRTRWNGKVLGKTFHSFDPVAPLWEDERFHARLSGSLSLEECLLELEVWQHQKSTGKSILAGVVSLTDIQLRQLVEDSNFSPTWFFIAPSPFMANALVSPKRPGGSRPDNSFDSISDLDGENITTEDPGLGQIQIRCGFGGKFLHMTESTVAYDFSVLSAKDLARADMLLGQSDPFVIAKWNSREIGRTPHASRTTNPVWTDQNFLLMIDPNEDIGQNLLQVEVWNHRVITKGEFLGCLNFTGPALVELYNNLSKHGRCLCDLEKSTTMALNRQHLVKGKLEIGLQLRRKDDSNTALSIKESLNMQWSDIWAEDAGAPFMKFQLCSVQDLPIVQNETPPTSKGRLVGATPAMSSVSCSLSWAGEEVVRTTPVTLEVGHKDKVEWSNEVHYFKVPADADESNEASILVLNLWDTTNSSKSVFMGRMEQSFKSLWTLYGGMFTFALKDQAPSEKPKDQPKAKGRDKEGSKISAIRGSVTFRVAMMFPFWNSAQSIVPRSYLRKLTICGAVNLPLVDDEKPNAKCVVIFDGAIKAKTIVMLNNIAPSWPRVDIDIIVDKDKPVEITVVVYHVNASDKKEVIIGQEIIPFEYLLRPPATVFDLFLGPGPKRITDFKFTTSGSARLQVSGSNKLSESSLPFSHRLERPVAALVAKDVRGYGRERLTRLDHELNGELLSPDERLWLGTATDFVNPQLISCRPEWVMMPVQDIGMRIGPRKTDLIGTNPGFQFSLLIEREAGKDNVSDPLMLQDLTTAVSECITNLRKKDIFRCIRERAMGSLGLQIKALTNRTGFDTDTIMKLIFDCVSVCYPGVQMRTAIVSQDFKALHYSHYGKFGSSVAQRRTTLYQEQGSDWELIGRTFVKSQITSKATDFTGKIITTFDPLPLCRFPRFSIPLRSGDAALGFFQVEDFDIQKGGLNGGSLADESEMRSWFENIGDLCGAALYTGNEVKALASIDDFCKCWNSSINGLIADLANDSFSVVQGCRMMEILTIDEEYNIQSLLERKPAATKLPGNMVVLQSITFKVHVEEKVEKNTKLGRRFSAIGAGGAAAISDMFKRRGSVFGGPKPDVPSIVTPSPLPVEEEAIRSDLSRQYTANEDMVEETVAKKYMLVGVRYDGMEQVHATEFNEETQSCTIPATHITIKSDRVIVLSLYEVDEHAKILAEYVGKINFATFQETELSASMCAPLPAGATNFSNPIMFDATAAVHWPTKFVFTGEHKERTNIKGFNLSVKRARDLVGDKHGHADSFCEITVGSKMIKQTEVKKKTITPVWEEEVMLPYDGHSGLFVDVYNMNFLRKGDFLGRVEIPYEHLLNSTGDEVDYPLLLKPNVDVKKQTKVGGTLTLACSVVEHAPRNKKNKGAKVTIADENGEGGEGDAEAEVPVEIPKEVWSMLCPTLHLTVKSATDLAKANMFGGASDPFVLIFLGHDTEPIEKTHFIDNTLNPKWNSAFDIMLGVTLERGVTTIANFPTLRLEVYDYNKVKAMDFMGSCEITPAMYFSSQEADMPLVALPKKKSNLVKGNLQAEFSIFDKIVQHNSHVYSFTPMRSLQTIVAVEVHILKARGLLQSNKVGNSDPYVVVKWNNQICGTTSVKTNTLNPSWSGEKFLVNIITHGSFDVGELVMEVWDKDFFKEGDFLGEVRVTGDVFMHPPASTMDLPLMPKSGDITALTKVAGTLTVRLFANVVPQRPPCQQRTAVEYKMEQPKLDAMKLLMAYDTDAEAKRQRKEGVQFNSILDKVSAQMEKYLNSPFERTGLISELHFGQLTAASRRAEQTVLKTPLVDMICVPTYQRGARPDQCYYLVARYDAGKIPRRDMEFMGKIRKKLNQGLTHINEREGRLSSLAELEKGLELFSKATDNTSGMIVQTILDLEVTLNCVAKLYLLGSDGITLTKCSADIGEVDPETPPADDFIHNAAHVCRHGVMIQKYRREHSVVSLQWENFTQLTLPPLQSMAVTFDELEKPNIVKDIIAAGEGAVPDGAILAPLMAHGEVFVGLLCLSKIDGTPCANYRVVPQVEASEVATSTKGKPAESTATKKKPYDVVERLEHGYTNKIKNACRHFADGIVTSRLGTLYRKIKSFPIKADTDPLKIIRYAFRLLVIAIPAIRTISVWGVNMSREPVLIFSKPEEAIPAPGIFSRLVSMSSRMSISSRLSSRVNSTRLLPTEGRLSQLMGLSSKKVPALEPPVPAAPVVRPDPAIVAGMFGAEHPELLLAAPIERVAFGANEQRLNTRYSAVGGHQNIITAVKDKNNEKHARWKVDVPGVIRKAAQALNAIKEDDEDDDESFGSEDSSAADDSKLHAKISDFEDNAMNMIHAEIIRCAKVLQSKTFRIISGHILSAVGSSVQSQEILHGFFPQPAMDVTPPPPDYSDATPSAATKSSVRSNAPPARAPLPPEPAPVASAASPGAAQRTNTILTMGRIPPGGANAAPRRLPPSAAKSPSSAPSSAADNSNSASASPGRAPTIHGNSNAPLLQHRARPPPTLIAQNNIAKKTKSPLRYFVAVNTNGIGGESGWGIMGESMEKIVANITDLIETNLMKLAEARNKADLEKSRISPKEDVNASATGPGRSPGIAKNGAYAGSEDNSWLRPSQMSEMEENSLDADSNSDDMEEID